MSIALASPTVQDMLQMVRRMLRQTDPANSAWSDEELLAYLNEGVRIYFAELTDVDEGYFTAVTGTTTPDIDLVSGQEEYALPADFFKIKVLYKKRTDGYSSLPYRNTLNEGFMTDTGDSPDLYAPYYFFRGNRLVLRPAPAFNEDDGIRVEYMQMPASLLDGSDQLTAQISPIFRQVVEMYTVYKAKMVESLVTGTDTMSIAKDNLSDLVTQFRKVSQMRSKNPTFVVPFNPED